MRHIETITRLLRPVIFDCYTSFSHLVKNISLSFTAIILNVSAELFIMHYTNETATKYDFGPA